MASMLLPLQVLGSFLRGVTGAIAAYTPSLNFSNARNSMYVGQVV